MTITEEPSVTAVAKSEDPCAVVEDYGKEPIKPFKAEIVWKNLVGFAILHLGCLYGLFLTLSFNVMFPTFLWCTALMFFAGVSVTLGAHRLWSHKSYKATNLLKAILVIGQTVAGQNCLWVWIRDHRLHHKYSDTDADPHNSTRGFWFCHIGWLMMKKHPEVIAKGRLINMTDINAEPMIMFQKKYYKSLYLIFAFLGPVCVPWYFWGEDFSKAMYTCYFARYMLQANVTWCVNSVAHLWGTRPYSEHISPVESPIVSYLGQGEGWHNYHHTFPWDCNAAEFGKHYNTTGKLIQLFEKLGLAYDLKYVTPEMIKHRADKYGDGSWIPVNRY